jgi:putative ABC transport system permease protein
MKIEDMLLMSVNSLRNRKLRSWLTALGVVVGVASVVALVSIGEGLQQSISSQLNGLGANIITVSAGFSRAGGGFQIGGEGGFGFGQRTEKNLTESDARIIKTIPGVAYVDGIVSGRTSIDYNGQTASASIQGVDPSSWKNMVTANLTAGRYLSSGDTYVAVIGSNIATGTFKLPISINRQISINGVNFRVVGVLQSSGGISLSGGGDSVIYIPVGVSRNVLDNGYTFNQLSSISVQTSDASSTQSVADLITKNLLLTRHETNSTKDFTVSSAAQLQSQVSTITSTITLFLGGIAAISLFVGGIGIANTMFMSVVERTRQIGILKALGTTNNEVMGLFLSESALLGLVGGVVGVILGFLISTLISGIGSGSGGFLLRGGAGGAAGSGLQTYVPPWLVVLGIGFSVIIGMISGIFPARRAAKLQPVEALRYE